MDPTKDERAELGLQLLREAWEAAITGRRKMVRQFAGHQVQAIMFYRREWWGAVDTIHALTDSVLSASPLDLALMPDLSVRVHSVTDRGRYIATHERVIAVADTLRPVPHHSDQADQDLMWDWFFNVVAALLRDDQAVVGKFAAKLEGVNPDFWPDDHPDADCFTTKWWIRRAASYASFNFLPPGTRV